MSDIHKARRQKLLQQLKAADLEGLLVTNFVNVTYLTGFTGDDSFLLVSRAATILISDGRYTTQLSQECPDLEVHIRSVKSSILTATAQVLAKAGVRNIGIESNSTTIAEYERLTSQLQNCDLVPTEGRVEALRMIKDGDEVQQLRAAVRQAEKGFAVLRATLRGEQTEREVAFDLEHAMRQFGAKGASFPPIIAGGPRSALPHARPTDALISTADFVLVDWGAEGATGYKSDLTRLVVTGKISPKLENVYRVVLKAQLAGIAVIRPGARCCDVDAAARKVIEEAGFGKNFNHGLGHGIGLDIHEGPRLNAATDLELKPGMVVTVEPGIYLPGWGGVRIEDDILVTRHGHEVLTSVPKEFESAILN